MSVSYSCWHMKDARVQSGGPSLEKKTCVATHQRSWKCVTWIYFPHSTFQQATYFSISFLNSPPILLCRQIKLREFIFYITTQEKMYFPIREINSSLPQKSVKWHRVSNCSFFQASIIVLCMRVVWDHITKRTSWIKRTKPHIENHNIWVVGRFVSEEFNDND